jgi:hypothetical protein
LPEFRELERAEGVPPGTYDGIVGAYCTECTERWTTDEKEANFAVLAESVGRAELLVRRGYILRDARHLPIPDERDDFRIELLDDR